MPRSAKQAKLKHGEIAYESLFGKIDNSTPDEGKSDLTQCTDSDCKMLDIVSVTPSFSNRPTMPITQPILVPLWHEPSNDDATEKTMYYVRGTDVDLNQLDENGLAGGSDSEPQIVYKVIPNTHAHVIRYVMAEDEEQIDESQILELVDISTDQRRSIRVSGKSDSVNNRNNWKGVQSNKTGIEVAEIVDDDDVIPYEYIKTENRDTRAAAATITSQQVSASQIPNTTKENTELKDKCRVLELKCKWSDQKIAQMQSEMKQLKEEMMQIRQSQYAANSTTTTVRKESKFLSFGLGLNAIFIQLYCLGQRKPERIKVLDNQQIKEEALWEEDNDAEYLDIMMLDEEYVDEDDV